MQGERAPDQTSAGCSIEVEKGWLIGILHKVGEGGAKGVPLSDMGVVEASVASLFRISAPPSRCGTLASSMRVRIFAGSPWGWRSSSTVRWEGHTQRWVTEYRALIIFETHPLPRPGLLTGFSLGEVRASGNLWSGG